MTFKTEKCKAIINEKGKECCQPVEEGSEFCRWHNAKTKKSTGKRQKKKKNPEQKIGNLNSFKHGAYSLRLLPEEETLYKEKLEIFTKALDDVDEFDKQILHMLACISTKLDQAIMKGAEHSAYAGMVRQILDLMKELKATRASKSDNPNRQNVTYADLFQKLKTHFEKNIKEPEINENNENQFKKTCTNCLKETWHEIKHKIVLECQNCGHLSWTDTVYYIVDDESEKKEKVAGG